MRALVMASMSLVALAGAFSLAHAAEEADDTHWGEQLFIDRCGGCHLEGGFGTRVLQRRVPKGQAELEKRDVLPAAFTKAVVRRGIGSMPQIRAAELSDGDLQAIAGYLENGS